MVTKRLMTNFLSSAGVNINGGSPHDVRINDNRLYQNLLTHPSLKMGESYMEGYWDCDQLDELFFRITHKQLDAKIYSKWMIGMQSLLNKTINFQTRSKSKRVAEVHYNLGNDFYQDMLGESMAYTCAYWKDATGLDQAQYNKFDLICRKIDLKPGDRVLDLGCGWGSLAKFMAENYGCEVVGVNISTEQIKYARENCKDLPVKFFLSDYRDSKNYNHENRLFDKVVSIGLCEHVGYKNYKEFMATARKNLKNDGLFLLHTIGKNFTSNFVDPWINKYIFPNGVLPSIKLLSEAVENVFVIEDLHNFGTDYDKTLMAWHKNFNQSWPKYQEQYGQKFFRLWNYYLLICAGVFRARGMQLWQIVLSPKGVMGGYETIR